MAQIEHPAAYEAATRRRIIYNATITFRRNVADADEIIDTVRSGADRGNPFMASLAQGFESHGKLSEKQCQAVRDSMGKTAERKAVWAAEAAVKNLKRVHIGTIGAKKVEITVTTKKIIAIQGAAFSYYDSGVSYLHIAEDSAGNVITYKGKGDFPAEGETATIHCTIKAHQEYLGAKQTVVMRPKMLETA